MNKKILITFILIIILSTVIYIVIKLNKNNIQVPQYIPQDYYAKIIYGNKHFYTYTENNNDPKRLSDKKYYFIETSIDSETNLEKIVRKQYIAYPQDIWKEVNEKSKVIINTDTFSAKYNKGDIINLSDFLMLISID